MPYQIRRVHHPLKKNQKNKNKKALVGTVLDALSNNGFDSSTVIVLWGDHGWYVYDALKYECTDGPPPGRETSTPSVFSSGRTLPLYS